LRSLPGHGYEGQSILERLKQSADLSNAKNWLGISKDGKGGATVEQIHAYRELYAALLATGSVLQNLEGNAQLAFERRRHVEEGEKEDVGSSDKTPSSFSSRPARKKRFAREYTV